jgi:hypothetical protein
MAHGITIHHHHLSAAAFELMLLIVLALAGTATVLTVLQTSLAGGGDTVVPARSDVIQPQPRSLESPAAPAP